MPNLLKKRPDLQTFSRMVGEDFDKAYVRHQVVGHEKYIKIFEKLAAKRDERRTAGFAFKVRPTLRRDLAAPETISENLNASLENVVGRAARSFPGSRIPSRNE